jgi:hypothetical protein
MKSSAHTPPPLQSTRLLDQVRERIRSLHYSIRTEEAYFHWIRGFVRFHGLRHPIEIGSVGGIAPEPVPHPALAWAP